MCPRSQPILSLDLLEFFVDNAVDPGGTPAQAPELAESTHPRLAAVVSAEFVSDSLRDECPERNPTFGSNGAGNSRTLVAEGTVLTSTTAGTLQFKWAQGTSNGTATIVHAGSALVLWQIA